MYHSRLRCTPGLRCNRLPFAPAHKPRGPTLGKGHFDRVEVTWHLRIGKHLPRLALAVGGRIARRKMHEREHPHPRLAGQFSRTARGAMPRLQRPLGILLGKSSLMDQHISFVRGDAQRLTRFGIA